MLIMLIIASVGVMAASDFYYKLGEPADIKIPCIKGGSACDNTAECNITISYPNGELLADNVEMSYKAAYFNYTIPETTVLGEYDVFMYCIQAGENGHQAFKFKVNATGEENTNSTAMIVFMLIMAGISFLVAFFVLQSNKWLYYVFLQLGMLLTTVLAYFGWQLSMEWGSWNTIIYAIFFSMLIFTIFMFLLILVEITLNVVSWISTNKKAKLGDNLV